LPLVRRFGSKDPERRSRDEMALEVEGVVDGSDVTASTDAGRCR